jgi:hypothetical protein
MEPVNFEFTIEITPFYAPIQIEGDYYADNYGNIAVVIRSVHIICLGLEETPDITNAIDLGYIATRVRNIIKVQRLKENNYE